ncbi:MAG TPA: nuclear transport factor 2 family protein [Thermoanaerobaculia bacterium]|nr:nuclear transport factor 2 family protein [Thermoanaerobaculia bacterium]
MSKAGEVWNKLPHGGCVSPEEAKSSVQSYTDETIANTAGFNAFNEAFLKQDIDAIMANMTDDPVFEAPFFQPNGICFKGVLLVRLAWELTFKVGITFEVQESFSTGDRGVVRWNASAQVDGKKQTLSGCDVFYLKGGKVAAKLTYSKTDNFFGVKIPA